MIQKLAESKRTEQVFVRHAFRFWMGRNETINDAPVLQAAHKAYRDNDGSINALLTSLLTSVAFLYRQVERKRSGIERADLSLDGTSTAKCRHVLREPYSVLPFRTGLHSWRSASIGSM